MSRRLVSIWTWMQVFMPYYCTCSLSASWLKRMARKLLSQHIVRSPVISTFTLWNTVPAWTDSENTDFTCVSTCRLTIFNQVLCPVLPLQAYTLPFQCLLSTSISKADFPQPLSPSKTSKSFGSFNCFSSAGRYIQCNNAVRPGSLSSLYTADMAATRQWRQ